MITLTNYSTSFYRAEEELSTFHISRLLFLSLQNKGFEGKLSDTAVQFHYYETVMKV
jgi:hypothetical protein